jgi:histidyl-tRNA synthetase
MFRYERPQKGRQRQFHQVGVEVLGSADPRADVEVIALATDILQALGLKNLTFYLNSVGDRDDRARYRELWSTTSRPTPPISMRIRAIASAAIRCVFSTAKTKKPRPLRRTRPAF